MEDDDTLAVPVSTGLQSTGTVGLWEKSDMTVAELSSAQQAVTERYQDLERLMTTLAANDVNADELVGKISSGLVGPVEWAVETTTMLMDSLSQHRDINPKTKTVFFAKAIDQVLRNPAMASRSGKVGANESVMQIARHVVKLLMHIIGESDDQTKTKRALGAAVTAAVNAMAPVLGEMMKITNGLSGATVKTIVSKTTAEVIATIAMILPNVLTAIANLFDCGTMAPIVGPNPQAGTSVRDNEGRILGADPRILTVLSPLLVGAEFGKATREDGIGWTYNVINMLTALKGMKIDMPENNFADLMALYVSGSLKSSVHTGDLFMVDLVELLFAYLLGSRSVEEGEVKYVDGSGDGDLWSSALTANPTDSASDSIKYARVTVSNTEGAVRRYLLDALQGIRDEYNESKRCFNYQALADVDPSVRWLYVAIATCATQEWIPSTTEMVRAAIHLNGLREELEETHFIHATNNTYLPAQMFLGTSATAGIACTSSAACLTFLLGLSELTDKPFTSVVLPTSFGVTQVDGVLSAEFTHGISSGSKLLVHASDPSLPPSIDVDQELSTQPDDVARLVKYVITAQANPCALKYARHNPLGDEELTDRIRETLEEELGREPDEAEINTKISKLPASKVAEMAVALINMVILHGLDKLCANADKQVAEHEGDDDEDDQATTFADEIAEMIYTATSTTAPTEGDKETLMKLILAIGVKSFLSGIIFACNACPMFFSDDDDRETEEAGHIAKFEEMMPGLLKHYRTWTNHGISLPIFKVEVDWLYQYSIVEGLNKGESLALSLCSESKWDALAMIAGIPEGSNSLLFPLLSLSAAHSYSSADPAPETPSMADLTHWSEEEVPLLAFGYVKELMSNSDPFKVPLGAEAFCDKCTDVIADHRVSADGGGVGLELKYASKFNTREICTAMLFVICDHGLPDFKVAMCSGTSRNLAHLKHSFLSRASGGIKADRPMVLGPAHLGQTPKDTFAAISPDRGSLGAAAYWRYSKHAKSEADKAPLGMQVPCEGMRLTGSSAALPMLHFGPIGEIVPGETDMLLSANTRSKPLDACIGTLGVPLFQAVARVCATDSSVNSFMQAVLTSSKASARSFAATIHSLDDTDRHNFILAITALAGYWPGTRDVDIVTPTDDDDDDEGEETITYKSICPDGAMWTDCPHESRAFLVPTNSKDDIAIIEGGGVQTKKLYKLYSEVASGSSVLALIGSPDNVWQTDGGLESGGMLTAGALASLVDLAAPMPATMRGRHHAHKEAWSQSITLSHIAAFADGRDFDNLFRLFSTSSFKVGNVNKLVDAIKANNKQFDSLEVVKREANSHCSYRECVPTNRQSTALVLQTGLPVTDQIKTVSDTDSATGFGATLVGPSFIANVVKNITIADQTVQRHADIKDIEQHVQALCTALDHGTPEERSSAMETLQALEATLQKAKVTREDLNATGLSESECATKAGNMVFARIMSAAHDAAGSSLVDSPSRSTRGAKRRAADNVESPANGPVAANDPEQEEDDEEAVANHEAPRSASRKSKSRRKQTDGASSGRSKRKSTDGAGASRSKRSRQSK